jgi:DivIVA domain-containing protein
MIEIPIGQVKVTMPARRRDRLSSRHTPGGAMAPHLTASDVRNVTFKKPPLGRRGYDEEEADKFLSPNYLALK